MDLTKEQIKEAWTIAISLAPVCGGTLDYMFNEVVKAFRNRLALEDKAVEEPNPQSSESPPT